MKGWQKFLLCWRLPMVIVLVLLVLCSVLVGVITHKISAPPAKPADATPPTAQEKFEAAVADAMVAEDSEIRKLVCLTAEDDNATVDENGKASLLIWHASPNDYPKGETVALGGRDAWTFTDKEISSWYRQHKKEMNAEEITRLEQLTGQAPGSGNTHFTLVKADVSKVIRPAYQTDPTKSDMTDSFTAQPAAEYLTWFNANIIASYFDGSVPWTRLGYTYDWSDSEDDYGLTQFLISGSNSVEVINTMTNEEFLTLLKNGRAFDGSAS